MNIGMLWFDNDPKLEMKAKVKRAAQYYENKYGRMPNLCYVHPTMLAVEAVQADGIEIRATKSVLPHHFWIGIYSDPPVTGQ